MLPALGFKTLAIAILVASVVSGVAGARIQKKLDNAAYYKALSDAKDKIINQLRGQIAGINTAAKNDQQRAADAERQRVAAQETADELAKRLSDRVCFDERNNPRSLWPSAAPAGR